MGRLIEKLQGEQPNCQYSGDFSTVKKKLFPEKDSKD
jgi:hypothetical protein